MGFHLIEKKRILVKLEKAKAPSRDYILRTILFNQCLYVPSQCSFCSLAVSLLFAFAFLYIFTLHHAFSCSLLTLRMCMHMRVTTRAEARVLQCGADTVKQFYQ